MPRILVIIPFPLDGEALASRAQQARALQLDPDTSLIHRPVAAGPISIASHQDWMLADLAVLEAGLSAQQEGFDAVCVDAMSDAGLSALRSVLDIPVVAPGKASMLYALSLGSRFSLLAPSEAEAHRFRKAAVEHGLRHQCASVRTFAAPPALDLAADGNEPDVFPALLDSAGRCIDEDGADVICLGSTMLHRAAARLAAALPVPVVDPAPLMLKLVETLLALGLRHSRRAYAEPIRRKEELIRALMRGAAQHEREGGR